MLLHEGGTCKKSPEEESESLHPTKRCQEMRTGRKGPRTLPDTKGTLTPSRFRKSLREACQIRDGFERMLLTQEVSGHQ